MITKKQVAKVYETLVNKEISAHQTNTQAPFVVQGNDKDLTLNNKNNSVANGLSDALIIELARLANAKQILLYLATDGKSVAELALYADVPSQDFLTKYMIEIANSDDLIKVWNGSNDDYFVESLAQELDYCYTMAE